MAIRIASYNVENLFSRPKAFNLPTWSDGKPIVEAYQKLNALFNKTTYSAQDKKKMKELMVKLDLYRVRPNGAVRRLRSTNPKWAWLRKNRGSFDDLNEGPKSGATRAENLEPLYTANRLLDCYALTGFNVGQRPGSFDSCGLRNCLDYIFISKSLEPAFIGGEVFRKGLWGTRKTRPDKWDTYPEMTDSSHQASDHAALVIELDSPQL